MEGLQEENRGYDPEISVVMPVYNKEKYMTAAIESVLSQSFNNFELTIVDDGSTDKSRQIAMDYSDIPFVRIIFMQKNSGVSVALNTGINASMGRYYTFFAPDDIMGINALSTLHEVIEGQPEDVAMIYTQSFVIDEEGGIVDEIIGSDPYDPHGPCTVNMASCIIKMEYLMKIQELYGYIYDPSLRSACEWDLWIRLSKIGKIKVGLGEPLTYYRKHEDSLSQKPIHAMCKGEIARRLANNVYGLHNPNITTYSMGD